MKKLFSKRSVFTSICIIGMASISAHADVHTGPAAPAEDDLSYQVYHEMLDDCMESGLEINECVKLVNSEFAPETEKRRQSED